MYFGKTSTAHGQAFDFLIEFQRVGEMGLKIPVNVPEPLFLVSHVPLVNNFLENYFYFFFFLVLVSFQNTTLPTKWISFLIRFSATSRLACSVMPGPVEWLVYPSDTHKQNSTQSELPWSLCWLQSVWSWNTCFGCVRSLIVSQQGSHVLCCLFWSPPRTRNRITLTYSLTLTLRKRKLGMFGW